MRNLSILLAAFLASSCVSFAQDAEQEAAKAALAKRLTQLPQDASTYLDVPYVEGTKPGVSYQSTQLLDVFVPAGKGPFPLIFHVHGGGWRSGGKEPVGVFLAIAALPLGFAVASVDYRYIQDASFPAQIEDCNAALIFLRKHAAEYRIDPDKVGVVGHSAGGHLSALMAATGDGKTFTEEAGAAKVQASVCWSGAYDLDRDRGKWPPSTIPWVDPTFLKCFFPGGGYHTDLAQKASPMDYVHSSMPPMLIVHGGADQVVPVGQTEAFVETLKQAGVDVTYRFVPTGDHNSLSGSVIDEAMAFFQKTLMGK